MARPRVQQGQRVRDRGTTTVYFTGAEKAVLRRHGRALGLSVNGAVRKAMAEVGLTYLGALASARSGETAEALQQGAA